MIKTTTSKLGSSFASLINCTARRTRSSSSSSSTSLCCSSTQQSLRVVKLNLVNMAMTSKGGKSGDNNKRSNSSLAASTSGEKKRSKTKKSPRKPKAVIKVETPKEWREVYSEITTFREKGPLAPVDTMGCERLADPEADPKTYRFQTLVSLMLSSQTKDQVTAAAVKRLQERGLTVDNVANNLSEEEIDELICKVGFHNTKAKRIKAAAKICLDKYDGDIPDTAELLQELPGVGPKMAYITMNVAFGKPSGIGVDVHVHRITNRLGWNTTKTPEDTRKALESWLPVEKWISINPLLVGFGQLHCLPRNPKCNECPVRNYCAFSQNGAPSD